MPFVLETYRKYFSLEGFMSQRGRSELSTGFSSRMSPEHSSGIPPVDSSCLFFLLGCQKARFPKILETISRINPKRDFLREFLIESD